MPTTAQLAALREISEWGGRITNGCGVSVSSIRALERQGLVTVEWGKTTEKLAPGGWTGRVYITHHWYAVMTETGHLTLAAGSC